MVELVVQVGEGEVPAEWLTLLRESGRGCGVGSWLRNVGLEDGLVDAPTATLPAGRRNSRSHGLGRIGG